MKYSFTTPECSSLFKEKIDITHSTIAESIDDAVSKLYKNLRYYKWTKEQIRHELEVNNEQ